MYFIIYKSIKNIETRMNYTFNFDEFLFENVFKKSNKMYFNLSQRLYGLLNSINHKISKDLIKMHNQFDNLSDMTYIDYHDDDYNLFTFSRSGKIYDDILDSTDKGDDEDFIRWYGATRGEEDVIRSKYRSNIRIGRFINKIFPDKYRESGLPGEDIQTFIDNIKSKRSGVNEIFKIVEGDDIIKYYNVNSYSLENGEENMLHKSCMKYDKCSPYLDFYIKNNVKMVILMSENGDKINGRALLWKLTSPDRYFMDRIYTIYSYDIETFKNYAIKNNWLYKKNQNREPYEMICDPSNDVCNNMDLIIENIKVTEKFPYLDTLSHLYKDHNILSNNENLDKSGDIYFLQSTDGYYTVDNKIFVPYYNRLIDQDDLFWCSLGEENRLIDDCVWVINIDEYATIEYARKNLDFSGIMDGWLDPNKEDVIYLEEYEDSVTTAYASAFMKFSEYYNEYILNDDAIWSKYHNSYIIKDSSIMVKYIDKDAITIDYVDVSKKLDFKPVKDKQNEILYYIPKNNKKK